MSNKFFKDLKKSLEEVVAYKKGKLDLYSEYIETTGEDALTALKFLFRAMSKKNTGISFSRDPQNDLHG